MKEGFVLLLSLSKSLSLVVESEHENKLNNFQAKVLFYFKRCLQVQ